VQCRSVFIKEVFEICDHRSLVRDVLSDFMEVTIVAVNSATKTETEKVTKPEKVAAQPPVKKFVEPITMSDFKKQLEAGGST
jgi:hypothetical protein